MRQLYTYILLGLLLAGKMVTAQSFTTKVSAKVIGKNDAIQVEYIAENLDLQEIVLPVFNGWSILSGPNFSSNRLQTGNIIKQQTVYTLTLQPQATGRLTVPGAKATIDNKIKLSNFVSVEVKNVEHVQGSTPAAGSSQPGFSPDQLAPGEQDVNEDQVLRKGENARDKIKNNLFVRLDVNKKSSYVGEPILATYKLCTRIRSQSRVVKQPAFSGCTVFEMTSDDPLPQREQIGGKWYNVYIIRQVQLIPLQAGSLVLPQASIENTVTFYKEGQVNYRDLFYNNPAVKPEELTVTFSNKPMELEIKPLPQPAPAGFGGAVGNFDVHIGSADAMDENKSTNAILLTISGEGNLQQMKVPVVTWPKGIEGFDATEKEEVDKAVFPAHINKTITYPYVASKSGNYTIPPVEFTYFNASKSKYVTTLSAPLRVNVVKGTKTIFSSSTRNPTNSFYTRLYLLLGGGLLAILIGLLWYHRTHKTAAPLPKPTLKQEVIAAAPQVDTDQFVYQVRELEPMGDGPAFYKQLHRSLTAWLLGKYNISVTEIGAFSNAHPDKIVALQKLDVVLRSCSVGMYTPMYNTEEAMQHRLSALEAINALEKSVG